THTDDDEGVQLRGLFVIPSHPGTPPGQDAQERRDAEVGRGPHEWSPPIRNERQRGAGDQEVPDVPRAISYPHREGRWRACEIAHLADEGVGDGEHARYESVRLR